MTIRQYWVHYDEPIHPEPMHPKAEPPAASAPLPTSGVPAEWEKILNALLDLIEPHPAIYRAALHLLAGRTGPLPPLPPQYRSG
jgi:hypothetical protein